MAFDSETRRRLAGFVTSARGLLQSEFAELLPSTFGIRLNGTSDPVESLIGLDEPGLQLAETLRERITYLAVNLSTEKTDAAKTKWAVDQLAREQAFTVLNRLAAIRMAEKRGIVQESVAKGFQSKAFRVFENLAGNSLGETFPKYRQFLNCLFDELAVDLGLLFDRNAPQGLLFPRETAFLKLLELFNDRDLENLWAEDETIGWIYQYYNDPDERREMREKSSAPRNSRELAVRNQFFTPRYVVEFLTDNTLGRIWYEMCQGQTNLKDRCRYLVRRPNEIFLKEGEAAPEPPKQDNLSQEELLKQPVYIPHRQLKDPRTILMLDPACGSMHFGLYAFDLFEEIYHEAWVREEQNPGALLRPTGMKLLHQSYPNRALFLADIPRLIIEHNIHGVDIDHRATQIATLSLWLRAHRTWNDQKTPLAQRPKITKSHIVCAEPMPGNPALLQEFVKASFPENEHSLFQRLLEQIFIKMQLAGEAGSLLKIEEEITSAVEEAKVAWAKSRSLSKELFGTSELNAAKKPGSQADLLGLDTALLALDVPTDFWESIEERIYAALRDYADQAETGAAFQHRLFAEDAARGFAFIDVCRKRYDVALMNPPFGEVTLRTKDYLIDQFPSSYSDIYTCFVDRFISQVQGESRRVGVISNRTFLTLGAHTKFRLSAFFNKGHLEVLVDLGSGVLDAMVEVASYVISRDEQGHTNPIFFPVHNTENKAGALLDLIEGKEAGGAIRTIREFRDLPNSPLAYWLSHSLTKHFTSGISLEGHAACARVGLQTSDDNRFARLRWEAPCGPTKHAKWIPFAKGGEFSPYYDDIHLVVNWEESGREIKNYCDRDGKTLSKPQNTDWYFQFGLSYPWRTSLGFAPRVLPRGCIFAAQGSALLPLPSSASKEKDALCLVAALNSSLFQKFISIGVGAIEGAARSYQVGLVQSLPWVRNVPDDSKAAISAVALKCVNLRRMFDCWDETTNLFINHVGLLAIDIRRLGFYPSYEKLSEATRAMASELVVKADNAEKLIQALFGADDVENLAHVSLEESLAQRLPNITFFATAFCSYMLGIAVGRWDIRFATGEQVAPDLLDPFSPLPVCPPGQLQNAQGLPASQEDVPATYIVRIPWDGILVDDPNHPLDLERRVREVIEIIWSGQAGGPTAEAIEHEACEILGVKSLRDYFRKPAGFFADHLKRYSKSRRQAPIYWPLSSSKGNYTLWIYYHRLNDQTLHTVLLDFVSPKLEALKNEISHLREMNGAPTRLAELLDFQDEMKEFELEIKRIIDLPWKPNLNDGVLITASPLWKLFRLPTWQRNLKTTWQELEKGDYDWSHLAYSIWPARVEEKCKSDRSLAIAHGLEHLCTVEAPKPKRGRKTKSEEIEDNDLYLTEGESNESSKEFPSIPKRRGRPPKNSSGGK